MYNSNLNYSSFWLDRSIWEDDDNQPTKVEKKSNDLMKLMSYKRSISNFVNIVTGQPIPVTFNGRGEDSYTDGQQVVISAKMNDKEFDPVVGLALHEGSHVKLTNFTTLKQLMDNDGFPSSMDDIIKPHYTYNDGGDIIWSDDWWRVSDDIKTKLKNLLNYVEDRRIDNYIYKSAPGYRGYYEAMYNKYFHSSVVDKGLKSDSHRDETWESYMFRLINITNKNRDLNALKGLRKIWNLLDLKNISRLRTTDDALELAGEIYSVIQNNIDEHMDTEPQQGGDGQGQDGDTDGKSDMSSNDNPTADAPPMEGNGMGNGKDSKGDDGDDGDSTDKKGSQSTGLGNKNGAGGNFTPLNDRQKKMLENAIKKQEKFLEGDIQKKTISKADKKKLDTLDQADIETEVTGKGINQGYYRNASQGVQTYVIKNVTKNLIDSGIVPHLGTWRLDSNDTAVRKGITLGTILGKKLKTRNEERINNTPRMKSGKLNGRMLHEIGFGNFQIFDQININTATPCLLHISIDASSSMSGDKWYNTQTAAVAIAKAASMTDNMNVVISYRGIYYNSGSGCQPLMMIAYDSRKDKFQKIQNLFKYISPSGTTPEGLCFEAILKELVKTKNGTDSYLINFSDGWPGFDNKEISYNGQYAVDHTAEQVKKVRQAGVGVLSYFISDGYYGSSKSYFEQMYGKDSEFINVDNMTQLAKTLNKKFEVKI
tara:strand:+ start:146 stop:2269 length:2124 start_codon:yes stop_codon:yes gene_type:complete